LGHHAGAERKTGDGAEGAEKEEIKSNDAFRAMLLGGKGKDESKDTEEAKEEARDVEMKDGAA
jgi:hypothetical protein